MAGKLEYNAALLFAVRMDLLKGSLESFRLAAFGVELEHDAGFPWCNRLVVLNPRDIVGAEEHHEGIAFFRTVLVCFLVLGYSVVLRSVNDTRRPCTVPGELSPHDVFVAANATQTCTHLVTSFHTMGSRVRRWHHGDGRLARGAWVYELVVARKLALELTTAVALVLAREWEARGQCALARGWEVMVSGSTTHNAKHDEE